MNNNETKAPCVQISSSPYLHCGNSVSAAMRDVLIALIPTVIAAVYFFGIQALILIATCILSAMASEALCQKIMRRPITIADGSAALTGLLLALCLPSTLPLTMGIFGSFCAIVIGKQVFGGLGYNIFNPAHIGRAILLASFPAQMTYWTNPLTAATNLTTSATPNQAMDAVTTATPLAILRQSESLWAHGYGSNNLPSLWDMFIGNTGGSLGETCIPALLLGGLFLLYKKHIDWRIPIFYIGTVTLIAAIYGYLLGYPSIFALYHFCSGGLIIGAFFMATDWVTSPITTRGRIIFAIGLGIITATIRLRGSYVEGVCYSILIMNMMTPLIDRFVTTIPFGGAKHHE